MAFALLPAQPLLAGGTQSGAAWIEPAAGTWHTWVLTLASRAELEHVRALTQQRDAAAPDLPPTVYDVRAAAAGRGVLNENP